MSDLISREALKEKFQNLWNYDADYSIFKQIETLIDNAPPVPLPDFKDGYKQAIRDGKTQYKKQQGEWLHPYKVDIACECSVCNMQMPITDYFNFCPNCGADMRKEAENE